MPKDYPTQDCAIARSLEVLGERWTLLIVRDMFYGVTHFNDLHRHLGMPKAVLRDRLARLADEGVVDRNSSESSAYATYALTESGRELWPVVRSLAAWGERHRPPTAQHRIYVHFPCAATLERTGQCPACRTHPSPEEICTELHPRQNSIEAASPPRDRIETVLQHPHRLLTEI